MIRTFSRAMIAKEFSLRRMEDSVEALQVSRAFSAARRHVGDEWDLPPGKTLKDVKICTNCDTEKPLSEFSRYSRGMGGVFADCRLCRTRKGRTVPSICPRCGERFMAYAAQVRRTATPCCSRECAGIRVIGQSVPIHQEIPTKNKGYYRHKGSWRASFTINGHRINCNLGPISERAAAYFSSMLRERMMAQFVQTRKYDSRGRPVIDAEDARWLNASRVLLRQLRNEVKKQMSEA